MGPEQVRGDKLKNRLSALRAPLSKKISEYFMRADIDQVKKKAFTFRSYVDGLYVKARLILIDNTSTEIHAAAKMIAALEGIASGRFTGLTMWAADHLEQSLTHFAAMPNEAMEIIVRQRAGSKDMAPILQGKQKLVESLDQLNRNMTPGTLYGIAATAARTRDMLSPYVLKLGEGWMVKSEKENPGIQLHIIEIHAAALGTLLELRKIKK